MAGGADPSRVQHECEAIMSERLRPSGPTSRATTSSWASTASCPATLSPERPTFNYSYVNYVGKSTFGGFPGTDRESPALVREAIDELRKVYPVKHYLVGGHSQGGYLAFSLLMNSPEAFAGAFPISGEVIFQCEPSAYADAKLKAAQRSVPLAIVHGKNGPADTSDGGSYAYGLFLDAGWPAVRLFSDDTAGHMFARQPVGAAIRWLEVMTSEDPKALLDFAEQRLKEHGYRDAIAAARRARGLTLEAQDKVRLERVLAAIDAQAAPKARTYLAAIKAAKDHSWVDGFLDFRKEFEFADAAHEAMAAFNDLRARHDPARGQAHRRGPRALPARPPRRRAGQGQGDRREVLRVVPLRPGQEVAGRAEAVTEQRTACFRRNVPRPYEPRALRSSSSMARRSFATPA